MSTITKFSSLREAQKVAREEVREFSEDLEVAGTLGSRGSVLVLRPDGDTDRFHYDHKARRVIRTRECGWITRGNFISPSDVPCVIS